MHSHHKPYDRSTVILIGPTIEEILERFPHIVQHDAKYQSIKWQDMTQWCRTTIGESDKCWTWLVSNQFRFPNESDAVLFSLTWS